MSRLIGRQSSVLVDPFSSLHSLALKSRAFSFYDIQKKDWNAEPGDFTILVGGSSDKIQLHGKFTLTR